MITPPKSRPEESSFPLRAISNHRILIVDDNEAIHADFRKIFGVDPTHAEFETKEEEIFGDSGKPAYRAEFEMDFASQGREALERVQTAVAANKRYAMVFMDIRMPPGWDGLSTTLKLWKVDPDLQVVICTAYSDYSWDEIIKAIPCPERLLILKKPFDPIEVLQFAHSLTEKWSLLQAARANAEELHNAREAAEAANRAKSTFLANMSHEIRTPLNAILGFSQLMLREQTLPPNQKESLSIINSSGKHLLALVNGILEMSKIEAGHITLDLAPFELQSLLDDLQTMFDGHTDATRLKLLVERHGEIPQCVIGDESKLRQVFINLIGNAIKFTTSGAITVRIGTLPGGQSPDFWLWAEVEDTGAGISQEEMTRLFQRFEQTESGRKIGRGTGLGLTISREFIRLMGGDITAQSELGKGSVFRFEVRLAVGEKSTVAQDENVSQGAPHLLAGTSSPRVLIVDDEKENRKLLSEMLALAGFEFSEAANASDAIKRFECWHPHLILMDLRMPEMDGNEAIGRIRAMPGGESTKIVLITASAFAENRTEAILAGADRFMSKPFRDTELFENIRALLGVSYVYTTELSSLPTAADGGAVVILSPESLRGLPHDTLIQMREAVGTGDYDRVLDLISSIDTLDASIVEGLRKLARQFDSTRLLQLMATPEATD